MIAKIGMRFLRETDKRLLWNFVWNFGWKGMRAVQRFEKRRKQGEIFPAFLFLSITNRCNLRCQGCWSTMTDPSKEMDVDTLDRIITGAKKRGSRFFGLLGGEPLLHKGLLDICERHPDCYFQIFTNGQLLTNEIAAEMRRIGNITPLISVEGRERVSDERRGGKNVWQGSMNALENCRRNRLITGVATSVCKSNIADLATREFLHEMIEKGVHYAWYYIYRPVGPNPSPELALSREEIISLRQFMVDARVDTPIGIVDAYWDHEGKALCPAVVGMSHHIGPGGDIEPCPPIQFARDNVEDGSDIFDKLNDSEFMRAFREKIGEETQGCIIMDNPAMLRQFMIDQGAYDSSGRGTALEELAGMEKRPSHNIPGAEIPEKSWAYRMAKKYWFFGFGAYG